MWWWRMFYQPGVYVNPEKHTTVEEEIIYLVNKHNEIEFEQDNEITRKNIEEIKKNLEHLLLLHPDLSHLVKLKKWK
jgi:hypothetical protein